MMWVIFPGLALTPGDYATLRRDLGALVFDAWTVDLTAPLEEIRAHVLDELRSHHPDWDTQEKLSLLGHSMGGLLALEWAVCFPEEVASVVLADPTPPTSEEPAPVSARRQQVMARLLAPVFPALRAAMWAAQTRSKEQLSRQELKRRYGTHTGARALIRHNAQCAALQRRVDRAVKEHGVPEALPVLQLVGAPSGPPEAPTWRGRLGAPGVSQLREVGRWLIDYVVWLLQRGFVNEQKVLAQRIGARLEFLSGVNHLFPITHPRRVVARMRAAAAHFRA